jgi:hypothetical protein
MKRSVLAAIAAPLLLSMAPPSRWWNTGIVEVRNNSPRRISVTFLEADGLRSGATPPAPPQIASGAVLSFGGRMAPWCDNVNELRTKAIVVSTTKSRGRPATELFRLCQNYRDDKVYYVRGTASGWEGRIPCASGRFPYITIVVTADALPVCKG